MSVTVTALRLARRAAAPVDDLGFVDFETVIVAGGEARRRTDRAVDVDHLAAAPADQVMMVVIHAILVPGRRPGGLDPADEVLVGQDAECIVYRLAGDRPDDPPDVLDELVGGGVGMRRHGPHYRQTLRCHLETVPAKKLTQFPRHEVQTKPNYGRCQLFRGTAAREPSRSPVRLWTSPRPASIFPAMYDVIVIGGSYAGIAAALQLARARRSVLILDAGQRRNRFARHSHGFLGQDGEPPDAIAEKGRAEVLAYPTVTWRDDPATAARSISGGFAVGTGSDEHKGRRVILATGVVDELPAIPGLAERWGKTVFLCPYCDGYELNLGRLGVLATGPASAHFAVVVSEWAATGQTTFFVNGAVDPQARQLPEFASRDIKVEHEPVVSAGGETPRIAMSLRDGRTVELDGLFLHPRTRFTASFAEQLGCELEDGALGPIYKTDAMKETTVPGVFACGDVALPMSSVSLAVADGARAGVAAHKSLIFGPEPGSPKAPSSATSR